MHGRLHLARQLRHISKGHAGGISVFSVMHKLAANQQHHSHNQKRTGGPSKGHRGKV